MSTLVGLDVGDWLEKRAEKVGANAAFRLLAERTLDFADDCFVRTDGRVKTWARYDIRGEGRIQLGRLKSVEGTIGTIMACASRGEPRNTPSWVLDAVQYALGILR